MNNNLKSVSIIIRSKNESKWIGSCLKAIKNQIYNKKKTQIIVLDNDSSDGTKNIIKNIRLGSLTISQKSIILEML